MALFSEKEPLKTAQPRFACGGRRTMHSVKKQIEQSYPNQMLPQSTMPFGPVALRRASELHTAYSVHLRVAWLEVPHPGLGYYNALRPPLESLGHNVTLMQASSSRGFRDGEQLGARLRAMDIAFVSFGFFPMEQGALPHLHEFSRDRSEMRPTLCGVVPLVVLINKEYALMQQKIAWLRQHCVEAALSVHHDVATFQNKSGVPFHRIWFGVDVGLFAQRPSLSTSLFAPQSSLPNKSHEYVYDLGFTGVVRRDQTNNWRYQIWRNAWPLLSKRGLRLFSGPRGGVHIGVAHAEINQSSYIEAMRGSKLWLSTTGPSDLVGTRYFEVMATGVTLCVCNRMSNELVYGSLGIKEGRHVVMFSTLAEFVDTVINYTSLSEYEERRLAIVQRAQELAFRKFSWMHVAKRVETVMRRTVVGDGKKHGGAGGRR